MEEQEEQLEKSTGTIWLERKSFRIALISTFTALSVVLGYMLVYLPNIEVFTLMIFLSGFILGKRDGAIVGFMSSFIFVARFLSSRSSFFLNRMYSTSSPRTTSSIVRSIR